MSNMIPTRFNTTVQSVIPAAQAAKARRLIFLAIAAISSLGAQSAAAYDFEVSAAQGYVEFHYVHITTVSRFCHDRTPLDINKGDQPRTSVSGSTAPGCLINGVQVSVAGSPLMSWSGMGSPGGRWVVVNESTKGDQRTPAHLCLIRPGLPSEGMFPGDCK